MAAGVPASGETYVQVAGGMRSSGCCLSLLDLAPSTLHVIGMPEPVLGYLPTGDFLDRWEDQRREFAANPPEATLALLDGSAGDRADPVMRLRDPRISATGLTYQADLVTGVLPAASGACVLFIHPSCAVPGRGPGARFGR